ncbi:hypothetical protein N7452_000541 [Penicillium brevicompactum]|uniref:Fatty acid hydroxylase domain-containing protein n=1 Tax=Penicillium brevicompactum TaxID=5074 RepID=A0A9W9UNP2_PENBR|nr:hypothetical protein N7452_000541 [Penicillium brevicompactum]
MDALFCVPMLSVFLIPVLSSYSTTLNFLFFYMTWSTLVLSHTPLRVEIFGTIAIRVLFYALPSAVMFLFDILTPSAAVVIKAHGSTGLPGGKRRRNIRLREIKVAGWSLLNLTLAIALQWAIETTCVRAFKMRSALKVSLKLPMPYEMVRDLLLGMLGREALTYVIHRFALHANESPLKRWHHFWYHALHAPFPLSGHYDHPVTYLLSNFIPTYLPAVLFRFHMLTYLIYLVIVSIEETFAYSGYTIMPTNFFLIGMARRMDMHVLTYGEGNFGPWGIMDWIFKTAIGDAELIDDEQDDAEERERERRSRTTYAASPKKKPTTPRPAKTTSAQGPAGRRR